MGILEFLTGRSAEEEHFYSDENAVNAVKEQLEGIKTTDIANARDAVVLSIENLNTLLNGYVEPLDTAIVEDAFNTISEQITSVSEKMSQTAADIKAYSESSAEEKVLGTGLMFLCKLGEGALSILEDIGDGAVSLAGWVAPKGSPLEKWSEDFVKKEWAHDAFNGFYNSDLAKASVITEDSFIANAAKFAGTTAGFVLLGAGTAKLASSGLKVAKAAEVVATHSKATNIATAAIMGMGVGTENGLKDGQSMDSAALRGAGKAAVSAGLAFLASQAYEKVSNHITNKRYAQLSRDHGFVTKDGTKIEVEINPDGTYPDTDLMHHLLEGEGINTKRGVVGAHTSDSFKQTLSDAGFPTDDCIVNTTAGKRGIIEYEYRFPRKDSTGAVLPGEFKTPFRNPKTVFDSTQYTDDDVARMAREAIADFLKTRKVVPGSGSNFFTGTAKNGVKFEGYIDAATGVIKTIYPVLH